MYKKAKSTKGITLVALVITVIVLLILSSVTINGLKGKNGIITKSTDAKEATAKATTLEDINLEILSAMSKGDGEVDNGALRNGFGDGANTIYLKADYKEKKSLSVDTSVITDEDMAVYKRMNPSWAAERGSVTKSNWKGDERAAGWLCAPSQWTTYVDSTKANYAIGGSSLEMYVDSYNQVPHTEIGNYVLGAKYSSETEGSTVYAGYRYTLNGSLSTISNIAHSTGDDTIDYIGYNSMYAGTNGTKTGSWWLSSTASRAPDGVSCVYGGWAMLSGATYISSFGIEPVVSLKTGVSVEIEE